MSSVVHRDTARILSRRRLRTSMEFSSGALRNVESSSSQLVHCCCEKKASKREELILDTQEKNIREKGGRCVVVIVLCQTRSGI